MPLKSTVSHSEGIHALQTYLWNFDFLSVALSFFLHISVLVAMFSSILFTGDILIFSLLKTFSIRRHVN